MKILKVLFQFYVFSNLHVSLAVYCFVQTTGLLFHINVLHESLLLACATFVAYHLIRYLNRFKYGKVHLLDHFSNQYKWLILLMNLIAFVGSFFLLLEFTVSQLIRLFPFGMLTLFYAFSFMKVKGERYSIRYIPGLKIFIIAFVWAGVVVFFSLDFSLQTILYFLELMLFVVVLTLPFDLRDFSFDVGKVKTLPIVLGVKKAKFLGVFLIISAVALHGFNFKSVGLWQFTFSSLILLLMLGFASTKQTKYYASFWVEGIPILYYLLLIYA
ncbi:UbiA prenyltransferase family protein [Wenyingzhuangia aestuarii]|uniref:hypothetical protein n=1 Tax=Wenyingzhuangia aestuarii TaxID=1647582 RepID=UPI00143AE414|nr:hypothetical protein [Wenyingzhuangia aestuarii]NJB82610.1 hypothetical protein [Wenyingzhuangia aestuarii]